MPAEVLQVHIQRHIQEFNNFYNIGATSSANPIANGLKWAKSGSTYQRPWNTPEKSILGGAQYLGEKYINAGQNTMYLQRFNVKSNGTYSIYTHQYMTNISGAASEAASTADAYQSLGIAAHAKTLSYLYLIICQMKVIQLHLE